MKDCNFPIITYDKNSNHLSWGASHGEEFKDTIKDLAQIRKDLMLNKNPRLKNDLERLALEQFSISKKFSPSIADEIEGIAKGSNLSLSEIVILNNYTDFRDIELPEEGCSTVHVQTDHHIFSGQTWDMHKSAKNFMCLLDVPEQNGYHSSLVLTLVGCVGLMGINNQSCLIGVNNINTKNAKVGLIWPLLVREVLKASNLSGMRECLKSAPVTSGHNYIISSNEGGEHWEITPQSQECVGKTHKKGYSFHTNHCLGDVAKELEDRTSSSSTTHKRFELLENKVQKIETFDQFQQLFEDHDNYPMSICSHYESGAQDPSFTCGGGTFSIKEGTINFWRGCKTEDDNYISHSYHLKDGIFIKK